MILFWLDTYRAVQMSSSWDGLGTKWYSSGLIHIEQFRCQVHERALTLNDTLLAYCNSSDVKFMTWPLHQIILFWHITTVQMSSSEWVSDCFLCQLSNFSAISWREQVNFQWDDDEIRFVLDQRAELDFYSAISLKQQSAGRHVVHSDTSSWFRANQKQQIQILYSLVWPDRGSNPPSITLEASTLTITPWMRLMSSSWNRWINII